MRLVKAQADRDVAERNYQAMQRLLQTGAASQAEVDAAKDRLRVADSDVHLLQQKLKGRYSQAQVGHVEAQKTEAQASLQAAQELLKNSNITAPRAGLVYSLPVRDGAFVNAGDLLVQVADLHKVRVRAFIDEPEIGKLRPGQSGRSHLGRASRASLEGYVGDPADNRGTARNAHRGRSNLRYRE